MNEQKDKDPPFNQSGVLSLRNPESLEGSRGSRDPSEPEFGVYSCSLLLRTQCYLRLSWKDWGHDGKSSGRNSAPAVRDRRNSRSTNIGTRVRGWRARSIPLARALKLPCRSGLILQTLYVNHPLANLSQAFIEIFAFGYRVYTPLWKCVIGKCTEMHKVSVTHAGPLGL